MHTSHRQIDLFSWDSVVVSFMSHYGPIAYEMMYRYPEKLRVRSKYWMHSESMRQ